jgi:hypothetical protein
MKISIEWTARTYFLKGIFFLLVFLLLCFGYGLSHTFTPGRVGLLSLVFGMATLDFAIAFRRRNRATQP